MESTYRPHPLEWTDEKVAHFWNFRNQYAPFENTWFTYQVGDAVLNLANQVSPIRGQVLDYGTGKGFLLKHLFDRNTGAHVHACDFSDTLVADCNRQYKQQAGFAGCEHIQSLPSVYAANQFDYVFLIETIEHLTDQYLHATLAEIHRVLKPGGTVIITTPNEEDLLQNMVHCADCGATFHHMQHIRSWHADQLNTLMQENKFAVLFCKAVNMQWYGKKGWMHRFRDFVRGFFTRTRTSNLVYIGRKQG